MKNDTNFRFVLKRLREEKHMSQQELADKLGVSQSTVGMWESGRNSPVFSKLEKIAAVFDVPVSTLLDNDRLFPARPSYRRIPVFGTVPAGVPIEAIEDIEDWEEISEESLDSGFEYMGLKIRGKSMEPEYRPGDVIIIRCQPTADTGDDAVVFVNGDDATFKRITINPDGIILRPLNPDYSPTFFSPQDIEDLPIRILGIAIEVRRTIRR